ncbi:carboxypeptidase-like regulatory domain-containing protein [Flavobacterium sp. RSB2_4_14]|uniref:carboxypeptidase-like regulatory domain-containing protein n=1 Tax=Flavobacterium sp. RSB2_4_14 TaxID=3447665 RepID=UPI003F3DD83D
MATKAANVALSVKAFANNTGDMALKKAMSLRASFLANRSENGSLDKCRFIHSKATELLGNLDTYGVTQDTLDDLNKSIRYFAEAIPAPRTNIVSRKRATDQLAVLFTECEGFLKAMDVLADMLEYRDVAFYATYFSSRKVIQPSYRTLSIVGRVTDASGLPLNKVQVFLKGTLISKLTTENGGFEIKNLESDVYDLQLLKSGYDLTTVSVAVTATDRTELAIVMPEVVAAKAKTA